LLSLHFGHLFFPGRYGFKQARWRGLTRVTIQDYLIAPIQNIMKLINIKPKKKITGIMPVIPAKSEANIPASLICFFIQNTKLFTS
jgi:hypothetical protein